MDPDRKERRSHVAEILLMVAGAVLALSSLFSYFSVTAKDATGSQSATVKGFDTDDGKFFISFGIVVLLLGLVLWFVRKRGWRVVLAVSALLVAGFMMWVAIADLSGLQDDVLRGVAASSGDTNQEGTFERLKEIAEVDTGLGLYVAATGAGLGILGALLAFGRGRRDPDPMASPLPAGWQPPGEGSAYERVTEPRSEEPSEWAPPPVDQSVQPAVPTHEHEPDPWSRRDPPAGG